MLSAAIDEDHVVVGAELTPQVSCRYDATAATAKDDDFFPPG